MQQCREQRVELKLLAVEQLGGFNADGVAFFGLEARKAGRREALDLGFTPAVQHGCFEMSCMAAVDAGDRFRCQGCQGIPIQASKAFAGDGTDL